MKYCGIIKFANQKDFSLTSLRQVQWKEGEMRKVNFFKGIISPVYLTSVDAPSFSEDLKLINSSKEPIILDLEWRVSFSSVIKHHISVFQFAANNITLIIRHINSKPNQLLKSFLMTHKFIGKSIGNDKSKLIDMFGSDFHIDLEDIVTSRLSPHGFSRNFNDFVNTFVGTPLFAIKNKSITLSNWERDHLTLDQVLYAAFDVVAVHLALPKLPLPVEKDDNQQIKQKRIINKTSKSSETEQGNEKTISPMSAAETASLLKKITFPLREPVPEDLILDRKQNLSIQQACKLTLIAFGNDPDEIPKTLKPNDIEDDDDEIRSEFIPSEAFDETNFIQTQAQQNANAMPEIEKPKIEENQMKYLESTSSDYSDFD